MKRDLLIQMKNEWRSNLWMCVELAIVSLVIWGCLVILAYYADIFYSHKGFDIENVYTGYIKHIDKESPEYTPYEADEQEGRYEEAYKLIQRIRQNPYVESAGFGRNAMPYQYNYFGNQLTVINDNDTINYPGNLRMMSPSMAVVLRLTGINGETPEEIKSQLEQGYDLVSTFDYISYYGFDINKMLGRTAFYGNDSTNTARIGSAIIKPIQRSDFEATWSGTIVTSIDETQPQHAELIGIRVKDGKGKEFMASLKENDDYTQVGNTYIANISDMRMVRDNCQSNNYINVRNYVVCIVFLLISVFLGLLGTFWFRIQQRTSEIAIRKANGATGADIFRRQISEGFILVVVATLLISVVEYLLIHFGALNIDGVNEIIAKDSNFGIVAAAATFLLLILITVVGITIPATKAMKIEPAIALKDE